MPVARAADIAGQHEAAIVVFGIEQETHADLFLVVQATAGMGPSSGLIQRGQQHGGQNCDDRDNDEYHLLNIHYGNILFYQ